MSTPQRTGWLNATVFFTGAGLMTIELVASRLIARFLGSSLYTWTGVLGVILAGMSLGNYLGGRMADSAPHLPRRIAAMLFASAAACLAILWLNAWAGSSVLLMGLSWPVRILLHMCWAFLLPATVLGTISPMVAKLAIERAAHTGRAIGTLYAWNAVGSIVGTFLTGFYLTAWMGSVRIVVSMALLLALMGLAYALVARRSGSGSGKSPVVAAAAATALMASFFLIAVLPLPALAHLATTLRLRDVPIEPDAIYYAETQYQILTVTAEEGNPAHRAFYQDKLRHSEIDLAHPETLQYPYHRLYEGYVNNARGRNADPVRLLCLGGGGYAYPQHLFVTRPGSDIIAVEIDPAVTRAAQAAFGLAPDAPITIHHMDARNYIADAVRQNAKTPGSVPPFDFIICDSISDYTVPYHLTTREFMQDVKSLLTPDGLFIMNTVDIYTSGRFMNAVNQTLREVFEHVAAISTITDLGQRDTTVWAAGANAIHPDRVPAHLHYPAQFRGFVLEDRHFADLYARNGACVLTDDWAPVENLLAPIVKMDRGGLVAAALQAGIRAAQKQDYPRAIGHFRHALTIAPAHEGALTNLGHAQELATDAHGALSTYSALIQLYPENVNARNRAAMLLARHGDIGPALEQWGESLKINPAQPEVLNNLGALAMQSGQRDKAVDYWRRALQYAPDAPILLQNLAAAGAEP